MIVKSKLLEKGFSINLLKDCEVEYPKNIWKKLGIGSKKVIVGNLVYLKVSPYSMFNQEMHFDFSLPKLKELGDRGVMGDIPRIAGEDRISTRELIKKFQNKKIRFNDEEIKVMDDFETKDSALIGMSFGKDSLLSYGIAKEIGLNSKLVMVQDFWDIEAEHKIFLIKKFKKEFNETVDIIYDELDDISTYKTINRNNSEGIVNANAMNSYLAMLLPLAVNYQAKYVVFGNEQNFNDFFVNKDGFKVYPSYDQSSEWMTEQNNALEGFTNGKVQVSSFIEPIYNIAEVKVLFSRYPSIARYQMSCGLANSENREERWCYNCPMCAKAFLYMKANDVDPRSVGFNSNFFDKKFERLYPLFSSPTRIYEKPKAVRDEQLFAFYLAFRNGNNGYLIEKFRKKFLKEAKSREDELFNKFFKVYDAVSISGKLKWEINSIYREELAK